jgi:hypothetical protein
MSERHNETAHYHNFGLAFHSALIHAASTYLIKRNTELGYYMNCCYSLLHYSVSLCIY